MARRKGSKNKATMAKEAALDVAAKRAAIHGTGLPDLKGSLDSLAVLEETMLHFYIKAKVEQSLGEKANWAAVDAAIEKAALYAEKVAAFRHAKLSAIKLAGGPPRPSDPATLDELIMGIKAELAKLSPILDLNALQVPEGIENRLPITGGGPRQGGWLLAREASMHARGFDRVGLAPIFALKICRNTPNYHSVLR